MSASVDWTLVLGSLNWTKQKFQNYAYPSYEMKQESVAEVDAAIVAIRALRDAEKEHA